ncbi:helix-turn-helix transcriptional regulator [Streptomyces sedi]|uniref:HTH luxR-type domain-containing protein n=1 Tax=Streptomyces sedi TaxID=555059 RepID=A0A5C4VEA0_9ACTN|nr:PAS domain-containing protein [Streptomyces sedi]TNM34213.1 hypothetical protein FH715_00490 [Streptomyces sedi]
MRHNDSHAGSFERSAEQPSSRPAEAETYVVHLDTALRVRHANAAFVSVFDGEGRGVFGRGIMDLVHPGVQRRLRSRLFALLDGRQDHFFMRAVVTSLGGTARPVALTAVAVYGEARKVSAMTLVMRGEAPGARDDVRPPPDPRETRTLTAINARILEGVAEGRSTSSLAVLVNLSRQGVEYHMTGLLREFGVPNRTALVSRAYASGALVRNSWPPRVAPEFLEP